MGLTMDYTEKLTDLIKGKLNDLDQQSLFSSLASDGTLRTEYNCIANISESISSNISSFAPSSNLKASIYSNGSEKASSYITNRANFLVLIN